MDKESDKQLLGDGSERRSSSTLREEFSSVIGTVDDGSPRSRSSTEALPRQTLYAPSLKQLVSPVKENNERPRSISLDGDRLRRRTTIFEVFQARQGFTSPPDNSPVKNVDPTRHGNQV